MGLVPFWFRVGREKLFFSRGKLGRSIRRERDLRANDWKGEAQLSQQFSALQHYQISAQTFRSRVKRAFGRKKRKPFHYLVF